MIWNVKCEGYEVRGAPQRKVSAKGNEYAYMVVESPVTCRSDQIICRDAATLLSPGLVKGDVIDFEAEVNLTGKYPSFEVARGSKIVKHRKSTVGGGN